MRTTMLAPALGVLALTGCGDDGGLGAFSTALQDCRSGAMTTDRVGGSRARYRVEGPADGHCRIAFEFLENPNSNLRDKALTFELDSHGDVAAQLRQATAECLEGRRGDHACAGELFTAVGGSAARDRGGPLPCGDAVANDEEPVYPLPRGESWGYVDAAGDWVIEPRFDRALAFSEGRALVERDTLWGVIDRSGEYVVEPQFHAQSYSTVDGRRIGSPPVKPFSQGCAAGLGSAADRPPFFLSRDGDVYWRESPPPALEDLDVREYGSFSEGLAWFRTYAFETGDRFGWIDAHGQVVIEASLAGAGRFSEGLAPAAREPRQWAFVGREGRPELPGKWRLGRAEPFSNGLAFVDLGTYDYGYLSREGGSFDRVTFPDGREPAQIDAGGAFRGGLAPVLIDTAEGSTLAYVEEDGKVALIPDELEGLTVCSRRPLPEFHHGLVRLLVADDGESCGDDANGLGLPAYRQAHYVYLNRHGDVVLRQDEADA